MVRRGTGAFTGFSLMGFGAGPYQSKGSLVYLHGSNALGAHPCRGLRRLGRRAREASPAQQPATSPVLTPGVSRDSTVFERHQQRTPDAGTVVGDHLQLTSSAHSSSRLSSHEQYPWMGASREHEGDGIAET